MTTHANLKNNLQTISLHTVICFLLCFVIISEYFEETTILISQPFVQDVTNGCSVVLNLSKPFEATNFFYDLSIFTCFLVVYPFILLKMWYFFKQGFFKMEIQKFSKLGGMLLTFHLFYIVIFFYCLLPFFIKNVNDLNDINLCFKTLQINTEPSLHEYFTLIKTLFSFTYVFFLSCLILIYGIFQKNIKTKKIVIYVLLFLIVFLCFNLVSIRLDLFISVEMLLNCVIFYELSNAIQVTNKTKLSIIAGRSRIRTYACLKQSRFTVYHLWPLGHPSNKKY